MASQSEAMNLDLYGILGVDRHATDKQILTAYRKQALKCHPDKNPDNPKAVERFHLLSKALELLSDAAARAAYDKVLDAKAASAARHRKLDSERKKFKEDLEAREKAAEIERLSQPTQKHKELSAEERLKKEIDRLREEGSALLKAEQERMREELNREKVCSEDALSNSDSPANENLADSYKLKIKWKAAKSDSSNGGYSAQLLESLFKRYGSVAALLVSSKKKGTAIVDYTTYAAALLALKETGLEENPLTVDWLTQPPTTSNASSNSTTNTSTIQSESKWTTQRDHTEQSFSAKEPVENRDFESLVLMRMRQAEERKRLATQLEEEESGS